MMSKHMKQIERNQIRFGLDTGKSISQIANEVGKDRSTIAREIKKHAQTVDKGAPGRIKNRCVNRTVCNQFQVCADLPDCTRKCSTCAYCNNNCPHFVEEKCPLLDNPPYVCNGCKSQHICTLMKRFYLPDIAWKEYRDTLTSAREGYNMTTLELRYTDTIVSPLIKRGQSIHNIFLYHGNELTVSESTVARLIKDRMLTVTVLDQQRVCKLKPRKRKAKQKKVDRQCRVGRTYFDFQSYMKNHPGLEAVQSDTVIGRVGGTSLLTVIFPKSDLMLAFLCNCHTAAAVRYWFDCLFEALTPAFAGILSVILTDNGSEFSDPQALEITSDGTQRAHVFYCDPMASWQKPEVERNHEFIRLILPKGSSFDHLTQEMVGLMMSHINSYSRPSLGNRSPFEVFAFMYGQECLERLLRLTCQTVIAPDLICLKPDLLR